MADGLSLVEHAVTIGVGVVTIIGAVAGAAFKLSSQLSANRGLFFAQIEKLGVRVEGQVDRLTSVFRDHEKDDQRRHEENIRQLANLNARVGALNGQPSGHHPD